MKAHRWNVPKTKKMTDIQYLFGVAGVLMCGSIHWFLVAHPCGAAVMKPMSEYLLCFLYFVMVFAIGSVVWGMFIFLTN